MEFLLQVARVHSQEWLCYNDGHILTRELQANLELAVVTARHIEA